MLRVVCMQCTWGVSRVTVCWELCQVAVNAAEAALFAYAHQKHGPDHSSPAGAGGPSARAKLVRVSQQLARRLQL